MAAGAGELLICLQKKPVDSGVGATRLQPRDHPLPSILGPSWLKTVGSTFFGSNSGQGKELWMAPLHPFLLQSISRVRDFQLVDVDGKEGEFPWLCHSQLVTLRNP